jgi:hypothetical protein
VAARKRQQESGSSTLERGGIRDIRATGLSGRWLVSISKAARTNSVKPGFWISLFMLKMIFLSASIDLFCSSFLNYDPDSERRLY